MFQELLLSAQSVIGFWKSDSDSINVGLHVWFDRKLKGQTRIRSIEYFWKKQYLISENDIRIVYYSTMLGSWSSTSVWLKGRGEAEAVKLDSQKREPNFTAVHSILFFSGKSTFKIVNKIINNKIKIINRYLHVRDSSCFYIHGRLHKCSMWTIFALFIFAAYYTYMECGEVPARLL